ncbi:hypothetical protein [Piscinibacter gummiphilus]|uniref:hypothetical protein n=1 Tax=Piscinibacter gummiphilus TaxID=946333 RepID=UPI0012F4F6E7|nr:hypothetical protein [Piscinibacter gummiphilus]
MNRRTLLGSLLTLCLSCLGGCVVEFEVLVANQTANPVVVEIGQFHSHGFDGTRPKAFTPDLLIQQQVLPLSAGEVRKIKFNSGAGGFWLRWRVIEPSSKQEESFTLDLIREEKSISIR